MMRYLRNLDWLMLASMIALVAIGAVFICSAGAPRASHTIQNLWKSHIVTAGIGLVVCLAISMVDYRKILDMAALPCFIGAVMMLVLVLFVGTDRFGGKRWLWFFQPSEISKLAVIMIIAQLFGGEFSHKLRNWKGLLLGFGILALAGGLILLEPDLGTALVLVPTVIAMLLAARVSRTLLVSLLVFGVIVAGGVVGSISIAEHRMNEAERTAFYAKLPLKHHQLNRIRTFVNPSADRYGSGWNLRQAKISIGSGSVAGKGIGKGEQKLGGYLPPSVSMNDFIFAVLAEESGFVGTATMLALFLCILIPGLFVANRATDDRGRLLVVGILTLVFFHVYENVAMSIGLMPITGLPLPFISAGRTFLMVLMASIGLIESVNVTSRISNSERNR